MKITDFGISKKYQKNNANETSGTPGYMAPEVLCKQNHSFAVDYYALGVIAYEWMLGFRPYHGNDRNEIKQQIFWKQATILKGEIPENWSLESADFINRLLIRKQSKRLGSRGATEVKEHSWFKYYPWKNLYLGLLQSPFIPQDEDNFDADYCNKVDIVNQKDKEKILKIITSSKYKKMFDKFTYFNRDIEENTDDEKNPNFIKNKYKNPHLVYYEDAEENNNDFDASIINRNILNIQKENQIFSEIKKVTRLSVLSSFNFEKNNLSRNRIHQSRSFSNKNGLKTNSIYNFKSLSRESGFGY